MKHNHQTWTFPAHKMIPPEWLTIRRKNGVVIHRTRTFAKVAKKVHKRKCRRFFKEEIARELNEYF